MGIRFNADEVLEMAIKIERNGAAFYRKAASQHPGEESMAMLEKLAAMEDEHEKTFLELRAQLTEQERKEQVYDPDGEVSLYLEALSDSHGGEGSPSAADALTGEESLAEIITIALGLEEKSILYYLGLRDFVPETLGRNKVDKVIAEERKHLTQLSDLLKK